MAAGIWNLIIESGASFAASITYEDPTGASPDLSSGYTAEMIFAESWDPDEAAALTLTESAGLTLGADGAIAVELTPVQTAALDVGELVHVLEVTKTSTGYVDRILKGTALVEPKAGG